MLYRTIEPVVEIVGFLISVLVVWLVCNVSDDAGDLVKELCQARAPLPSFLLWAFLYPPVVRGAVHERVCARPLHFVRRNELFLHIHIHIPLQRMPRLL